MFFTYQPFIVISLQSHEHATMHYAPNGDMLILSREESRSCARKWDMVGTWEANRATGFRAPNVAHFHEDSFATRMVATSLVRSGTRVTGIRFQKDEYTGAINVQESDGITTNPSSIRGNIRDREPGNARDKRRNVQNLYGSMTQATDVAAMHAIVERNRIARGE
jgi:hypothetical protein